MNPGRACQKSGEPRACFLGDEYWAEARSVSVPCRELGPWAAICQWLLNTVEARPGNGDAVTQAIVELRVALADLCEAYTWRGKLMVGQVSTQVKKWFVLATTFTDMWAVEGPTLWLASTTPGQLGTLHVEARPQASEATSARAAWLLKKAARV